MSESNDVGCPCVPRFVAAVLSGGRARMRSGARRSFTAGCELTRRVQRLTRAADPRAQARKLELLHAFLEQEDVEAVLDWFDREFPACMRLVPESGRMDFAFGTLLAHQQRNR